jgi:mannose-1-phosphate guanylyltransferase
MRTRESHLSAVILAGGQGRRLEGLTGRLGGDLPKQFSVITGRRSLLDRTVERIAALVPPHRVLVVVTEEQQDTAWRHLERWPEVKLIVEPEDRGTGAAVLVALAALLQRDPGGRCVLLPCDHHVPVVEPFIEAISDAAEASAWNPRQATLLGAVPDDTDGDHDWIFPGPSLAQFGLHRVLCYAASVPGGSLQRVHRASALWNTSILVGTTQRLWEIGRTSLPHHAARIAVAMESKPGSIVSRLAEVFASLPAADLDVAFLERAAGVNVRPFAGAGWSDWDTPHRVLDSLRGTPALAGLLARVAASSPWRETSARDATRLIDDMPGGSIARGIAHA